MASSYLYLTFVATHILLGRKISLPSAVALGGDVYLLLIMGILLDIVQIPFFLYVYSHSNRIGLFSSISKRIGDKSESMSSSRLMRWAQRWGKYGTLLLAAMPVQGGGMWSGVLLAHALNLDHRQAYALLTLGSVIGCTGIALGISGIMSLF
jgi:uncharacterized membrane protein